MRVLVTRPQPDADRTAEALRELGHAPILAPLATRLFLDPGPIDLARIQAILVTSANGVEGLTRLIGAGPFAVPLLAVGDRTASVAAAHGFTDSASAGGDADALVRLAQERLRPTGGPLLHVAGERRTGDIDVRLREAGFAVETREVYRFEPATSIPDAAARLLEAGGVDAILLLSAAHAETLVGLVAGGEVRVRGTPFVAALSGRIADAARPLGLRTRVAARPDEASLLVLLGGDRDADVAHPRTMQSGTGHV